MSANLPEECLYNLDTPGGIDLCGKCRLMAIRFKDSTQPFVASIATIRVERKTNPSRNKKIEYNFFQGNETCQ